MRELDCDLAQGFLFARPMAPAELTTMLANGGQLTTAPEIAAA